MVHSFLYIYNINEDKKKKAGTGLITDKDTLLRDRVKSECRYAN